jgi:hypothetical protein
MRVLFLLDNDEFIEVEPEKLALRQIEPGHAALGVMLDIVDRAEDGTVKLAEDGKTPLTQSAYRPLINYAVDIVTTTPTPTQQEVLQTTEA